MNPEPSKALLAVNLIVQQQKEVLLILRQNTGYADGLYSLPGGRVDAGESLTKAIIREAQEEIGIELCLADLSFFMLMQAPMAGHNIYDNVLHAFFLTHSWSGNIVNNEPHKCRKVRFFRLGQLPAHMTYYSRKVLYHLANPTQKPMYTHVKRVV
ncbi:MAG: NUDIX domain-containing protein [Bacteroidota bacterium]